MLRSQAGPFGYTAVVAKASATLPLVLCPPVAYTADGVHCIQRPRRKSNALCGSLRHLSRGVRMKQKDFDNLITSIRQAGKIRRGQTKPSRVTEFTPLDVKAIRQ